MGRKKGKGKSTRKVPTGKVTDAEEKYKTCPHSFVFHRGRVGRTVQELVLDTRRVMEPYTASNLREKNSNVLKDFVSVAGPLNVTHMLAFSKTEETISLRILRVPHGPTLTFRVQKFCLSNDVLSSLKRHYTNAEQYDHHPLLVMNNFSGEGLHFKLMATMFQNMFPSISVNEVKLKDMKRVVLLNYNSENETIDFRHYNIRAVPVGMSRAVKKLMKSNVPSMAKYEDISEFLIKNEDLSESEAELDGDHNEVVLPQKIGGKGNLKSSTSAIRLSELGPRMTLQLIKIEDGMSSGEVLYHAYMTKTQEELQLMRKKKAEKEKIRNKRKQQQASNVKRKLKAKEEHKQSSLAGMKRKADQDSDGHDNQDASVESEEEEDAAYYEQEVGEQPEPELFPKMKKQSLTMKRSEGYIKPLKAKRSKVEKSQDKGRERDVQDNDKMSDFEKLMKRRQMKNKKKAKAKAKASGGKRRTGNLGRR